MRRSDATAATEKRSIMHKAKDIQIVFKKSWKTVWNKVINVRSDTFGNPIFQKGLQN